MITATTVFLIFLTTIVVVELTDGKSAKPSNMKNQIEISDPYPIQDTPQQDTFNSQRHD